MTLSDKIIKSLRWIELFFNAGIDFVFTLQFCEYDVIVEVTSDVFFHLFSYGIVELMKHLRLTQIFNGMP